MDSGLYKELIKQGLLIPHKELGKGVIKPLQIPFISYPYEWSFSEFKDAALLTLKIQKIALNYGISLKDATSFNVQFLNGKPIFIDTLSFEKYKDGVPWIAYRQFCEQFLGPLALMSYRDPRISGLLVGGVGSIPLDLAASLLPIRAKFNPTLLLHIFAQTASQNRVNNLSIKNNQKSIKVGLGAMKELIDSLESSVKSLKLSSSKTTWGSYYFDNNNYLGVSMKSKKNLVTKYLKNIRPKLVWDAGANDGTFSRISANLGALTISFDNDYEAVENNYLQVKKNAEKNILPLFVDLIKPSPAIGWNLNERNSFFGRKKTDTILALALIHHLAIAGNLPLGMIAEFFAQITDNLIIEFIPKEDSQVKLLLAAREDIFPDYNQEIFEQEFSRYFTIKSKDKIASSLRTLYLMKRKR
ncbi:SAM-dependent methyltransferase [Patescibacteria group bacterium]|nr:SAM-dependent methyltransferase [Patescibacteria group bacterium]